MNVFKDRASAGKELAEKLLDYKSNSETISFFGDQCFLSRLPTTFG
jgi:hypothetical protein